MRFPFRKQAAPRWVDLADLAWTPQAPFPPGPEFAPGKKQEDAAPLVPANSNAAPLLIAPRLAIGLAQGFGFYLLLHGRDAGIWPGDNPWLFASLSLAGLFAPLILLEGLGEIPRRPLLLWAAIAAVALAGLGLYHHWSIQGPAQVHGGFALAVMAALMLVIGQSLVRAGVRGAKWMAPYRTQYDVTWTLAARLLIWAVMTSIAWALIGSGNSLFNWLRAHGYRLVLEPSLVILPLIGLASAAAFDMTAGRSWTRRQTRKAILACCTAALPMLAALSFAMMAGNFLGAPMSLAAALSLATLLVIGINASYRAGDKRGAWRRWSEFAAAFLILALTALAAAALAARVGELGWTANRIYGGAVLLVLGLYGLFYSGAALIGMGGGGWMQRIEPVNRLLSLVIMALCLALCSPLADPLRLAAALQTARLESGRTDPAAFDFAYLRRDGARFGNAALAVLRRSPDPEVARQADITLSAPLDREPPNPTEIGANIAVRTPGARLPASLLTQDWSALGRGVPPCLTKAALPCDAWFLDLDGDGRSEILLVYGNDARWWASILKAGSNGWVAAATLVSPACRGTLSALRAGNFTPANPLPGWRDLLVAGLRLSPVPAAVPPRPCALLK